MWTQAGSGASRGAGFTNTEGASSFQFSVFRKQKADGSLLKTGN
jgi:hypothetical protein